MMGFFSDRCEGVIDENGNALTGQALLEAQQDPRARRCGHKVKKAARGCSQCGAPAPTGWARCPNCRQWVGNESRYCWSCYHPLHPEDRGALEAGAWRRPPGTLARRLEAADLVDRLRSGKELLVQEGTFAILLQAGAVKDILNPGAHTLGSLGNKIVKWGDSPPRSVVLVQAGDIALPLRVEKLRTAEERPVELYTEIHIRIPTDKSTAAAFLANVMSESRELGPEALTDRLVSEIRQAAEDLANSSTIEDLIKDPNRRLDFEDKLGRTLKASEARYGYELVRVSAVEFWGEDYEAEREKKGEVEIKRRELEFDQQLRDILAKDRMHEFKTDQDLAEYIVQVAHEREVSKEHCDQELVLLQLARRQEIDRKEAEHAISIEMEKTAHEIGIKINWDDYETEKMLKREEVEAESAMVWLKVREEKERGRLRALAEEAKIFEGKSIESLIAVLPEDKIKMLTAWKEKEMTKGMSPSEVLAHAATSNPELVKVLIEMEKSKNDQRDDDLSEKKKLLDESADRLERLMNRMLDVTGEALKNQKGDSPTTVIK